MEQGSASTDLSLDRIHSHSDMTRQTEEMVAYARTLHGDEEADVDYLLDQLWEFATEFHAELDEHVEHEEAELFPSRETEQLSTSARLLLERIYDEHRSLEAITTKVLESLQKARRNSKTLPTDLVETIFVRCQLLHYKFELHSENERRFFKDPSVPEKT